MIRLDKYAADCKVGTRSEIKQYVKKGRMKVNGNVVTDSAFKIDPPKDEVTFDGTVLQYERFRYYMLNKPAGCVSATKDNLSDTVIELLKGEDVSDLFPVGRLDKDTEGFLLITNDGQLAHSLLSPRKHVDKTYEAIVDKKLSDSELKMFESGIDIGDEKPTLPATIRLLNEVSACFDTGSSVHNNPDNVVNYKYEVIIHEGRFHQVKRMFEAFGGSVLYLKRTKMGELRLPDDLESGGYRRLTEEEIDMLSDNLNR